MGKVQQCWAGKTTAVEAFFLQKIIHKATLPMIDFELRKSLRQDLARLISGQTRPEEFHDDAWLNLSDAVARKKHRPNKGLLPIPLPAAWSNGTTKARQRGLL
jgi:hypothetical protein